MPRAGLPLLLLFVSGCCPRPSIGEAPADSLRDFVLAFAENTAGCEIRLSRLEDDALLWHLGVESVEVAAGLRHLDYGVVPVGMVQIFPPEGERPAPPAEGDRIVVSALQIRRDSFFCAVTSRSMRCRRTGDRYVRED
jgi:hypothetical protein